MAQVLSEKEQQRENEQLYYQQYTKPIARIPDPLNLEEARKHPRYFNLANKEKLTNEILFPKNRNW